MSDLDQQARAIVEAGRDADLPTRADHDRIKRAVLVQIAAGGAVASTAVAGTLSLGAKVGLAVVAVTLVGGAAVGVLKARDSHPTAVPPPHLRPAAVTLPASTLPPAAAVGAVAPEPPAATDDQLRKAERPRKAASSLGRSEKGPDADQVSAEVEVLKRAREELRLGRPARALEALVEYDRRFGRGVLGEEREAMAAIAACQATPGPAAQAQAEAFMRKAPASPLRKRVREACITPARANSP
jgi:hypothetical protein